MATKKKVNNCIHFILFQLLLEEEKFGKKMSNQIIVTKKQSIVLPKTNCFNYYYIIYHVRVTLLPYTVKLNKNNEKKQNILNCNIFKK